jgi:hypothetical protein
MENQNHQSQSPLINEVNLNRKEYDAPRLTVIDSNKQTHSGHLPHSVEAAGYAHS